MDVAKVKALKTQLRSVTVALDTVECAAIELHAEVASISRTLDSLEKALQPKRFKPGEPVGAVNKPGGDGGQPAAQSD